LSAGGIRDDDLSAAVMAAMRWVLSLFLRLTGSMMPHPI